MGCGNYEDERGEHRAPLRPVRTRLLPDRADDLCLVPGSSRSKRVRLLGSLGVPYSRTGLASKAWNIAASAEPECT